MDSDERHQLYALREGALDAIVDQSEVTDAFKAWDTESRLSGKTGLSVTAGRDLWDADLAASASQLLSDMGLDRNFSDLLAFGLTARFIRWATAIAGRQAEDLEPEFTSRIGRRFETVIPDHWPTWMAVQRARDFLRDVKTQAARAEKRKGGAPPSFKAARRDGRWLALVEMRRATPETLGARYHQQKGPEHAEEAGMGRCDNCTRHVNSRLQAARVLVGRGRT